MSDKDTSVNAFGQFSSGPLEEVDRESISAIRAHLIQETKFLLHIRYVFNDRRLDGFYLFEL